MEENRKSSPIDSTSKSASISKGQMDGSPQMLSGWNYVSLGIEFAAIFGSMVWLGAYLDEKYSFSPIVILLGSIFGFAFGIIHIIRRTKV